MILMLAYMYYMVMVVSHCSYCTAGQLLTENSEAGTVSQATPLEELNNFDTEFDMKKSIAQIENLATDAENMVKSGTIPLEDVERVKDEMIAILDDIKDALKTPTNVTTFVEAQGFFRIFSINLHNNDTALRTKLLTLFKDLMEKIPEKTRAGIPLNIIDRILTIFETDDNLAIKAHAVDVLTKLLPKNPTAQLRVMKIKGLDVFYKQFNKLDISAIDALVELFNDIVKEHIEVRNDKDLKGNPEGKLIYQRMGLMELISTPTVCNGMLDVFSMLWSHDSHDHSNIKTFMDLLKNMNQFCSKIYKRKPRAITFFESVIKNVKEGDRVKYFDEHNVNLEEFINVVEDYMTKDEDVQKEAFRNELEDNTRKDSTKDEF